MRSLFFVHSILILKYGRPSSCSKPMQGLLRCWRELPRLGIALLGGQGECPSKVSSITYSYPPLRELVEAHRKREPQRFVREEEDRRKADAEKL